MQMIRLCIILLICFSTSAVVAQKPRYFVNGRETIPESLYYLRPASIESIQKLNKNQAALLLGISDSAVVVVMKRGSQIITFAELLKDYYIDWDGKAPIHSTHHDTIPAAERLLVSPSMISDISVHKHKDLNYSLFISVESVWYTVKPEIQIPLRAINIEYGIKGPR